MISDKTTGLDTEKLLKIAKNLVNTEHCKCNYTVQTPLPGNASSPPPLYGQPALSVQLCVAISSQDLVSVLLKRKYNQFHKNKQ